MASWLTSRLKAAEQLLQQIDQQAAITKEHLGNPNADLTSLLTPESLRGGRRANNNQSSSRAETSNIPSQSGNGKGLHSKGSHPPVGSTNTEVGAEPVKEDDFGKLDWTELLGSTDCNPLSSTRTQGPSKYVGDVRASDLHQKAGTTQEDHLDEHYMDALAHNNVPAITDDPAIQLGYEDGEFTDLELTLPEGAKYAKDADLGVITRDQILDGAPNLILEQTTVPVGEIEGRDTSTLARSDAVSLADENETKNIRMEAGGGAHQGVVDQDAALDKRCNTEETEVPRYTVQIVQGTDRHGDDEGSDEDSDGSSLSGQEQQSQSRSGSESDSEYEERVKRRRERRKHLAKRRAAVEATRAAIRDREELVAKLGEEEENLEKVLAEWEERQVNEAEELNLTMKEVFEAVEFERQHHASTRREGLEREAQLEAKSHELAKALAAAERSLEDESARVAFARGKVEAREIVQSDLQRELLRLQYRLRPTQPQVWNLKLQDSKPERTTAEEHFAELTARHEQYQIKAKQLEENIFLARDAHYTPSVMELELEGRLNQLTDHLIQKQSQVEALSTEKATLHFRLETITNSLRMEKSAAQSRASKRGSKGANPVTDWSTCNDDLEYGLSKPYSSKDKNILAGAVPDTVLTQTAGSNLARQVDSVFLIGARVLRTSGSARAVAAFYILLLHCWVLFIFVMHMRRSGGS